jgi:1,4-dihydroxy-2-naphthoate octaprenyltransferase
VTGVQTCALPIYITTDAAAGKRTLAVILGRRATVAEYRFLVVAAFAVPIALLLAGFGVVQLLPECSAPLAGPLLRITRGFREPRELNRVLAGTARLDLVFGLLFALALGLRGWPA